MLKPEDYAVFEIGSLKLTGWMAALGMVSFVGIIFLIGYTYGAGA